MTRHGLIRFVLVCGVLGGVFSIRADEPKKTDPKDAEIATLREKVAQQADEIQQLKAKLLEVEAARALNLIFTPPERAPAAGEQGPTGNRVPPHWVPRQFNGETYYLIPLTDAATGPTAAGPASAPPAVTPVPPTKRPAPPAPSKP